MDKVVKPVRVIKRGKSYQLYYINPDNLRRRISVGPDEAQAQRLAVRFTDWLLEGKDPEREQARAVEATKAQTVRFKDFFPVFMERHGKDQSENTQNLYHLFFRNICRCPRIAEAVLSEIRKDVVIDYRQARMQQDGVKSATANREVIFIKNVLQRAVEFDILPLNPLNGIRLLKEQNRRDVSNITPEVVAGLVEELPDSVADIVEFAVYTGFRLENVLGLQIEQVCIHDLQATGTVRHIVKGHKYRTDPLGKQAVVILKRLIQSRTQGYVFLSPATGDRYKSIHCTFDRVVRKLDIKIATGEKLCFHDLRRLCATWLLQNGLSLDTVREILGHSDRATTDRYARLKVSGDAFDVLPIVRK